MTNTRITDPEILELRYPVILSKFSLRPASGGAGAHTGGDGVIRKMTFRYFYHIENFPNDTWLYMYLKFYRAPMTLSVLTERRVHNPPGLAGGQPGQKGKNTLERADGRKINLGPKTAVSVYPGVRKTAIFSQNQQFLV